jgi:DNA-binding CsgD family transcriptional regulator
MSIAPVFVEACACFHRALDIYERLGDRQGAMATAIAMAFLSWAPEIHLTGSARRIEELHGLMMRMKSLTKESERALADAQMLFGAHVYSRAKIFPDLAISKGKDAYAAARALGDRSLEFALAGGIAMSYVDIGDADESGQWISRAAAIGSAEPTPLRARQLESWRGLNASMRGDPEGMREHLSQAVQLATDQGPPAARCEALAQLAAEAGRLGSEYASEDVLSLGERSAQQVLALAPLLHGHPTWAAQSQAALARIALARGLTAEAAEAGRAALAALDAAMKVDPHLDIVLPAAEALLSAGTEQEASAVRERLRLHLAVIAQHIQDEDIRVRWFRGPTGRELTRLAGPPDVSKRDGGDADRSSTSLKDAEIRLLQLLTQGRSNREIAEELNESGEQVARQLSDLYVKIGVSSRADATAAALLGKLV